MNPFWSQNAQALGTGDQLPGGVVGSCFPGGCHGPCGPVVPCGVPGCCGAGGQCGVHPGLPPLPGGCGGHCGPVGPCGVGGPCFQPSPCGAGGCHAGPLDLMAQMIQMQAQSQLHMQQTQQQMQLQMQQTQQQTQMLMELVGRVAGGQSGGVVGGPSSASTAGGAGGGSAGVGSGGVAASGQSSSSDLSKSAFKALDSKLIPAMPSCQPEKWTSRPQQVLGFRQWIEQMASWLSTLSPDYWSEIERVITGKPLEAKPGQIERSQRLFFLLKRLQMCSTTTKWCETLLTFTTLKLVKFRLQN